MYNMSVIFKIMKYIVTVLVLSMYTALCAPNATIANLGARGVTERGGTSGYAHYIPRLNGDGKLALTMFPSEIAADAIGNIAFVDPIDGKDTATGGPASPFKTINKALASKASVALYPGNHDTVLLDTVNDGSHHIATVISAVSAYEDTKVSDIRVTISDTQTCKITLVGLDIGTLTYMSTANPLEVVLINTKIGILVPPQGLTSDATVIMYKDATSVIGTTTLPEFAEYRNLSTADNIDFVTSTNVWGANVPNNVSVAIDTLASSWFTSPASLIDDTSIQQWQTWPLSPLFGVTPTEVDAWNTWSISPASGITLSDIGRWNMSASAFDANAASRVGYDDSTWITAGDSKGYIYNVITSTNLVVTANSDTINHPGPLTGTEFGEPLSITPEGAVTYYTWETNDYHVTAVVLGDGNPHAYGSFTITNANVKYTGSGMLPLTLASDTGNSTTITIDWLPITNIVDIASVDTVNSIVDAHINDDTAHGLPTIRTHTESAHGVTMDGGFRGGTSATAVAGGAIGKSANATYGGAIGNTANTTSGGAIGAGATSTYGGAIGNWAIATAGGAVGDGATAGDGFAGGKWAKTTESTMFGSPAIDAIQLGTGVNTETGTLQVYANRLLNADGTIPIERMGLITATQLGALTEEGDPIAMAEFVRRDYAEKLLYHYGTTNITVTTAEAFGFDPATGTITSYDTSYGFDVVIPWEIVGVEVVKIGDGAFAFKPIEKITGPRTVTSAGNGAFYACNSLTTVSLPQVTRVGDYAFYACNSLTTVSLPQVTRVGDGAFYACNSLTTVSLPQVTRVGNDAFYDCYNLTTVNLPQATSVGNYAFNDCSSLTTVNLPQVTSVGNDAFYDCSSLTTVNLPQVTSVGNYAFAICSSLTTISLPQATSVGDYAFESCSSLTTVNLPQATSVGNFAFSYRDGGSFVLHLSGAPVPGAQDVFTGSDDVTVYVHNPGEGWGTTWNDRPVVLVREEIRADSLKPADGFSDILLEADINLNGNTVIGMDNMLAETAALEPVERVTSGNIKPVLGRRMYELELNGPTILQLDRSDLYGYLHDNMITIEVHITQSTPASQLTIPYAPLWNWVGDMPEAMNDGEQLWLAIRMYKNLIYASVIWQGIPEAEEDILMFTFTNGYPESITLGSGYEPVSDTAEYNSGEGWKPYTSATIPLASGILMFRGDWCASGGNFAAMFWNTFSDAGYPVEVTGNFAYTGPPSRGIFHSTFAGCKGIVSIPEDLFKRMVGPIKEMSFSNTFEGCGITEIPARLFFNAYGPPQPQMFKDTFKDCTNLTAITNRVFLLSGSPALEMFSGTFSGCTSLTNATGVYFTSMDGTVATAMFHKLFEGCTNLTTVTENMFGYYSGGVQPGCFSRAFYNCHNLEGRSPGNKFGTPLYIAHPADHTQANMVGGCFYNCTKLTDHTLMQTTTMYQVWAAAPY